MEEEIFELKAVILKMFAHPPPIKNPGVSEKRGKIYSRNRPCHSWRTVKHLTAHLFNAEEPHRHDSKGWSEGHGEGEGSGDF
jgi:hypothetical protein